MISWSSATKQFNSGANWEVVSAEPTITDLVSVSIKNAQPFDHYVHNTSCRQNPISAAALDSKEVKAATVIQKYFRGYQAKKPHLPRSLIPRYLSECEKAKNDTLYLIPRAQSGVTQVFLPKEMPEVVLKKSGRVVATNRFHKMQKVRAVLDAHQCSNLIIPKANLCQDFLVEERLPINVDRYHNMGLYLHQSELFDEAVREMTRLFSEIHIDDLIFESDHPHSYNSDLRSYVRYDNLPLYVVEENGEKKGRIGLIDLESLSDRPNEKSLEQLVRIFPLHSEIIKNEAKKIGIQVNDELLDEIANKGKKYLQVQYEDHLNWLKKRDVSRDVYSQSFRVSAQTVKELTPIVEGELLKLNLGINDLYTVKSITKEPPKSFLTGNPEEVARDLAPTIIAIIIYNLEVQIYQFQGEQFPKFSSQWMTESELVASRSPLLSRLNLFYGVEYFMREQKGIKIECQDSNVYQDIATQLTSVIMENLVKSGDIFYYDPGYYTDGRNLCWIRY